MKVGLIGVGRMGTVLANRLKSNVEITIYDKDSECIKKKAHELGVNYVVEMEELLDRDVIILAIPDREILACIQEFNTMGNSINLISIATNVAQRTLDETAAEQVKCIAVKFIGQADEILAGDNPVIVINSCPAELVPVAKAVFHSLGQILVGEADMVTRINNLTARKVIEAAVMIEEELRQEGYTQDFLISTAIRQVGAGVLKVYSYNNLGPFGREIVQQVRAKLKQK